MNDESSSNEGQMPAVSEGSVTPVGLISLGQLIRRSFHETISRIKLLGASFVGFLAILVLTIVAFVIITVLFADLFTKAFGGWSLEMVLLIGVGILAYLIITVGSFVVFFAIMRAVVLRENRVGYWESILWSFKHLWPLLVIGLFIQLVTSTGYVLLILPGIAAAVYTLFSFMTFLTEDRKGMHALVRSTDLVYGRFWGVLWRVLALGLTIAFVFVALAAVIIILFGMIAPILVLPLLGFFALLAYAFMIVWFTFGLVLLYESLTLCKPSASYDPTRYDLLRKIFIIAAIIGVPVFLSWNVYSMSSELEQSFEIDRAEDVGFW